MPAIYTVDQLAGAGKTHHIMQFAIKRAIRGQKYAIVMPSKFLIEEWFQKTTAQALQPVIKVTRIDSDTHPYQVHRAIMEHLKTAEEGAGEILFLTQNAFFSLPYWHRKDLWNIVVDEIPSVVEDLSLKVPDSFGMITKCVDLQPFNHVYQEVRPVEELRADLARYGRNQNQDAVFGVFEKPARRILSKDWTVYVNTANYTKVLNKDDQQKAVLNIFAMMQPSVFDAFRTVTVMGAMFKHSLMYLLWQNRVEFRPHAIQRDLHKKVHENGNLLTIEYLFDRKWSKSLRDNRDLLPLITSEIQKAMGDRRFLYVCNKDQEQELAGKFKHGTQVPVVCHGLNSYDDIHNLAYVCALNGTPALHCFLEAFDVAPEELHRSTYLCALYQAVMRTSLRRPSSTSPKYVLVPDRDGAEYLVGYFPGCTVAQRPGMPNVGKGRNGRPKVWRDDAARNKAHKAKQRVLQELEELGAAPARVSLVASIYSPDLLSHEISSSRALMDELKVLSLQEVDAKDQNILISPALFASKQGVSTKRGLDNVEQISGIWLDKDAGHMTPEEFRRIFPDLWCAVFSTFSSNGRYRIFIPTTQPMTIDADKKVKHMILAQIERAGWTNEPSEAGNETPIYRTSVARFSGLDRSKLTANSLFYLPCRRKGDQHAFFTEYPGEELDPAA